MEIEKFTKWRTEDGVEHSSPEMAEQHIRNEALCKILSQADHMHAQEILNTLSGYAKDVRAWLDANDAATKAVMRSRPSPPTNSPITPRK